MTSPNDPAPVIPGAPLVAAEQDSELAQLVTEYDRLDAQVKELGEKLDTVKTRIKAELVNLRPGEAEVLLTAPGLEKPLRMWFQEKWTFDSKKLKSTDPMTWVQYARKSGAWYLGRSK